MSYRTEMNQDTRVVRQVEFKRSQVLKNLSKLEVSKVRYVAIEACGGAHFGGAGCYRRFKKRFMRQAVLSVFWRLKTVLDWICIRTSTGWWSLSDLQKIIAKYTAKVVLRRLTFWSSSAVAVRLE